ncbi:MAG: hypothetical protein Q8R91_10015 [Candidatus Omnitrophota bacterium]|nr:hypothetical protein [Candidatus Omnitrophota bacterium]
MKVEKRANELEFKVLNDGIQKASNEVLSRFDGLLKVKFPRDLPTVIELHIKLAHSSYLGILHLCRNSLDAQRRRVELASVASPIARSMLDGLFNVIYLGADPKRTIRDYRRAGWRELVEPHLRNQEKYGSLPEWNDWFAESRKLANSIGETEGLSDEDLKSVRVWPIPSRMAADSKNELPKEIREFLQYLNDWFYRAYSQEAHLTWPGLAQRAFPFVRDLRRESEKERLAKYKSDHIYRAALLLLMTLSEVNTQLSLGTSTQLQYLWVLLSEYFLESKELYQLRYQKLLT